MAAVQLKKDRLKALGVVLNNVKLDETKEFDMDTFVGVKVAKTPEIDQVFDSKTCKISTKTLKEGFCQTSACVLGFAALDSKFNAKGLKVQIAYGELDVTSEGSEVSGSVVFSSGGHKYEGFDAGEKFFGLTEGQAEVLFNGPWKTPKQAAKFVTELAEGKVHFATQAEINKDYENDDGGSGWTDATILDKNGKEVDEYARYVK